MNEATITKQSNAAYNQWCVQWREHAKESAKYKMKPFRDFENVGIGKAILCVANGYSFEEQLPIIKEHWQNVDILCCDKTLGHLLNAGIVPTYCVVCDANVDHVKYLEPWKDKLKDVILLVNVCANPQWAKLGNWKDIYFFVNQDIINSHLEFSKLSGCMNFVPAATNVSNAMIVLITQSDNVARRNYFGYDKIILSGFDYSWKAGGKYYAFDDDGGGKAQYMCHSYLYTIGGNFAYTSGNLTFSKDWLFKYIKTYNLPVVQCAGDSLLQLGKVSNLAEQMQYKCDPEDAVAVRKSIEQLRELETAMVAIQRRVHEFGKKHWWAHARTV